MSRLEGAGRWDDWNATGGPKYPHEKVVQFTFRNFPAESRAGAKVLDLGCGSGVHCAFLATEGFVVFGTDVSPVAIANTRARLQATGHSAQLRLGSVETIDYPDAFFHYVICISVLDCVGPAGAQRAMLEAVRVLRPGGKAMLFFASDKDFRVQGPNQLGLYGFSDAEVEAMVPRAGLARRWIDRCITTQKSQAEQQNDFLITLQKE